VCGLLETADVSCTLWSISEFANPEKHRNQIVYDVAMGTKEILSNYRLRKYQLIHALPQI
jgi:hypothetical protein